MPTASTTPVRRVLAPRQWWVHALALVLVVSAGLLGWWQLEAWQERRAAGRGRSHRGGAGAAGRRVGRRRRLPRGGARPACRADRQLSARGDVPGRRSAGRTRRSDRVVGRDAGDRHRDGLGAARGARVGRGRRRTPRRPGRRGHPRGAAAAERRVHRRRPRPRRRRAACAADPRRGAAGRRRRLLRVRRRAARPARHRVAGRGHPRAAAGTVTLHRGAQPALRPGVVGLRALRRVRLVAARARRGQRAPRRAEPTRPTDEDDPGGRAGSRPAVPSGP